MKHPLRIKDKQVVCDATNNPPTTCDKTLQIEVKVQFEGQSTGFYWLRIPIDLARLRSGRMRMVRVRYVR